MSGEAGDILAYHAIRTAAVLVRLLPEPAALGLGRMLGLFVFCGSRRRYQAYADLKAAFGSRFSASRRRQIARRHYEHVGRSLMEVLRLPALDTEAFVKRVDAEGLDFFYEVREKQKGIIFLTAHFGNWELFIRYARAKGVLLHAVARTQKRSRLNRLLTEFREGQGSIVAEKGMGLREILRALKERQSIGILGDQSAGKHEGIILPFFGRKTTVPAGAFELARKTGAPVIPAFIARQPGGRQRLWLEQPIELAADAGEEEIREAALKYVRLLEKRISEYPEQWLWAKKRWKYSWTRRLVILSDGKPGHFKQSQAIAGILSGIREQYGRSGMEYSVRTIEVRFRSRWKKKLFPWFALFFLPFCQGRLKVLRFFLEPETAGAVEEASCDWVISAGSSLVPLNLCLAGENQAKTVVIMKPSFPYNFFHYDMAVVPLHDSGPLPEKNIRTLLTLSRAASNGKQEEGAARPAENTGISVFLGGPTRSYEMKEERVRRLMEVMERNAVPGYAVTTSRRTPGPVCTYLKETAPSLARCRALVIASEDSRPDVVPAMMHAAHTLVVSEDSISMVSEAIQSGKRVFVVRLGNEARLPGKHRRFLEAVEAHGAARWVTVEQLEARLSAPENGPVADIAGEEEAAIRRHLEAML